MHETIAQHIAEPVKRFVSEPRRMLIGGKWVEAVSQKTFPVYEPSTGDILAHVAEGEAADIDRAVVAARAAFSGEWSRTTPADRTRIMWKFADLIEKHIDELAQLEAMNSGKPLGMTRALELPYVIDHIRYMAGWATKIEGSTLPLSVPPAYGKFNAFTIREAVGVVGVIVPWNFPLILATAKFAPALAAGCTVILKPAEETPLTALRLGELAQEAGFPDGVFNVVPGYGEKAGAALTAHPDVDKIAFTGSTEVGRLILHAAAGNFKKVSLELGGKSPNIILGDADLDMAIAGSANAIFFNQGEVCSAGSRLYVHKSVFDKVVDGISARAKSIRLGTSFDPQAEMGPLISERHMQRVCGYLDSGRSQGARAIVGGGRHGEKGYFVQPTVFVDTKHDMKIVQEEIFGPVLVAIPFSEVDELVHLANDSIYGLAAAIWTHDLARAQRIAAQIKAGTVWINTYSVMDPALPWGGHKQSGWGREGGHAPLDLYTHTKTVCMAI